MKKMNRKGFVLAEAIVVAVFVLGMFTYLALNIIPLITKYDQALKYDNPQEVYAANILLDELIAYSNNYSFPPYDTSIFEFSIAANGDFLDDSNTEIDYFNELLKNLNIENIKLLNNNLCSGLNRGITEYCKYLKERKTLEGVSQTDIILLIEFKNNKFSHVNANL